MKNIKRILAVILLVLTGFAAGFPFGQSRGFATGSEWASVQSSLIARELGLYMPVTLVEGNFRVVLKQPRGHFKRTQQLAEKHGAGVGHQNRSEKELAKNVSLIRRTNITQ